MLTKTLPTTPGIASPEMKAPRMRGFIEWS
jgi:hypothetical protein